MNLFKIKRMKTTKHKTTKTAEPIKPGYKKTKVGVIPEDWEVKRLGSQVHIDKRNIQSNFDQEYINYVSLSDISNGSITYQKIPFKEAPSRARRVAPKGSILFATVRPNLKNFAIVDRNDIIASTGFAVLESKKADIHFIFNFLYSYFAEKQFNALTVGSNYPALNSSDVKSLKIPIPPLPEQEAIADCLTTWDRAIEKQKKLINAKKLQKKGLMQQIFNGQLKVENACPEQGRKGQLIQAKDGEDFTKEWKEVRLGEVLKESKIISKENDKFKRISVRLHLEGVDQRPVRGTEADSTTFYKRKAGQFIYGKQNFHNGALGIIPEEFDGFETTSDIPSFDINDKINHKWFFYYGSRFDFYRKMESRTMGTGSKRLHPNELFSTKIPYPSLEEQTAIAEFLQTADKEIELLEKQLTQLELQKKGLMQVLLTGEKRLVS